MAVDPKTRKISAFVVETAWAGVKVSTGATSWDSGAGHRGDQLHELRAPCGKT
jgi:hypothetical protein